MKVTALQCRPVKKGFHIVSWLIMMFQGMSPFNKKSWSHMAMSVGDKYFDVAGSGAREQSEAEFLKEYEIVGRHEFNHDITMTDFYDFFNEFRGRGYDHVQLLGLALKVLGFVSFNMIGMNYKRLICNELIVLYMVKYHKLKVIDPDNYDLVITWNEVVKR